jgi:hypothetical protein
MTSVQFKEMMDAWPKKLGPQREIIQIISRKTFQPIKLIIYSQLASGSPYHDWFYSFNWNGNVFGSSERCYTMEDAIAEAWRHIGRLEQPRTFREFSKQAINVIRSFRRRHVPKLH